MIIGIDGNEANVERRVGIGEYSFELLKQFSEISSQNTEFRVYLKDEPVADMPEEGGGWKYRVIKPGKLWTQWRLPLDLYVNPNCPDVFFSPSHYAPRFCPVPSVISVMDLAYIYYPQLFNKYDLYQLKSWTAYSVKNAQKVLTISNSTKNDIIKEYSIASDSVAVTYPGIKGVESLEPKIYGMNQLKINYSISDNYILFVGTLQPRKNIQKLIEAFSQVLSALESSADIKISKKSSKDLQLVIVGKKGWLFEEILSAPRRLGIEDKVIFLEDIDNDELPLLYSNAKCLVLPSLYEGFGLPVLEAMKYNCPVITSDVSSLPEVGGDAALYINPDDATDIAEKITMLITDEKLRQDLIEKGQDQVKKFSWEKTARQTLKVLEEVGGKDER